METALDHLGPNLIEPEVVLTLQIVVHPEAARRANELAARALDGVADGELKTSPASVRYSPPVPETAVIDASRMKGPLLGSSVDRFGRDTELSYADASRAFVLSGPAFRDYERAVLMLYKQRTVSGVASEETTRRLAFEWICATHLHGPTSTFTDYIVSKLASLVTEVEIVLPIAGLQIHAPTMIGRVLIAGILPSDLRDWREQSRRRAGPGATAVDIAHDRLDRSMQGRAAARFKVTAEPEHAAALAMEHAELSLAVLRLAANGAFFPERSSWFALDGRAAPPRGSHIVLRPHAIQSYKEYLIRPEAYEDWVLDEPYLISVVLPMIGHWSDLLAKDSLTPLEDAALSSVLLYSRATSSKDISEKLIYIFAAIESLLLRSETEPISASVGDRLAFVVGDSVDERIAIVRNMREVYTMRSRFVHHAAEPRVDVTTLTRIETFLGTVGKFYTMMRALLTEHRDKNAMLDAIERRKYE